MVEFDSLPQQSRSLILATLGLEIASSNCRSVFELARKRHQSVADVWRDVCRKTGQPVCKMPPGVTSPDAIPGSPAPWTEASVAPQSHPDANANGMTRGNVSAVIPSHADVAATNQRSLNGRAIALAVGLAAVLIIGIATIVIMPGEKTTTTARPTEAIRVKSNETARADQPNVPPPQGTTRRLEEINKGFTKR